MQPDDKQDDEQPPDVRSTDLLLNEIVQVNAQLRRTSARGAKTAVVADALRLAAQTGDAHMVAVVTDYLAGRLPQRRIGVGWRGVSELPPPAAHPTLGVLGLDAALTDVAAVTGAGSAARRADAVRGLFATATADEQRWIAGLITGELRQGASDGVVQQAIAVASGVGEAKVRRAVMLAGLAAPVAVAAVTAATPAEAEAALDAVRLQVGRPLRPMLAASAAQLAEAMPADRSAVAVESKLDGIRIQAHLDTAAGQPVRLYTRTLEEVTDRMPEVVQALAALPARTAVLDGEVIVEQSGRPAPFQVTGSRTMSRSDPEQLRREAPLTTYLFDLMHLDGDDLVQAPAEHRWQRLQALAPHLLVPRVVTDDPAAAQAFFAERVAAGHEGVVVKSPQAPYAAGRRGAGWVKVKPRHTVDLVVLAVEWGSGRRRGLLSNIHLGARDAQTGEPVMVGKTFKGMTDAMLAWQTERFTELKTGEEGHVVWVRPEQVVEIAYDGVQRSRRYPGGVALRFARVLQYRDDKPVDQIDTVQSLQELL